MAKMTTEVGDRQHALDNEILRVIVGSQLHGLEVGDQDDRDEMGIFIEDRAHTLGLSEPQDHYVHRTKSEGVRSGPGDLDLTVYSLRKWMRLAVNGNPSVILPLFAPEEHVLIEQTLGSELRLLRHAIVSRGTLHAHWHYMMHQWGRMAGEKAGHMPKRPELVERYGFDTKYAGHALRLGMQGLELALEGRLTLPMDDEARKVIVDVRTGEYTETEALAMIQDVSDRLKNRLDSKVLPEKPNLDALSAWMETAHLRHWESLDR